MVSAGTDASVERINVLVVNDDGITAPGLVKLVACLAATQKFDIYVAAPDAERSAWGARRHVSFPPPRTKNTSYPASSSWSHKTRYAVVRLCAAISTLLNPTP
jgi:broad specificity polyphosphatase/5'/3'-nucleotidase SurE